MTSQNEMARNLLAQEPGREYRHATAADTLNVARPKRERHDGGTPYRVTPRAGDIFRIVVKGRDRWALEELRRMGREGCTSLANPAPRWSAYVYNLRNLGVEIETITETHGGDYAGHHGRYVLRCDVTLDRIGGAA